MTELKCDDKKKIINEIRNAYEYTLAREIYSCCDNASCAKAWTEYKKCRASDKMFREFIKEYKLIFANVFFNIRRKSWSVRDVINYIEDSEYNLTLKKNLRKLNINTDKLIMLKECANG